MLSSDDLEVHGVCVIGRSCSDEQSREKRESPSAFLPFCETGRVVGG
jgi:hypothetical protein